MLLQNPKISVFLPPFTAPLRRVMWSASRSYLTEGQRSIVGDLQVPPHFTLRWVLGSGVFYSITYYVIKCLHVRWLSMLASQHFSHEIDFNQARIVSLSNQSPSLIMAVLLHFLICTWRMQTWRHVQVKNLLTFSNFFPTKNYQPR